MRKLLLLIFSLISWGVFSQTMSFDLGNKAYDNQDYTKAIEFYLSELNSGNTSFQVFYNLGNSYYKNSDIPNSVLYYEKAKLLNPFDEDLIHNLSLANQQVVDKKETIEDVYLKGTKSSVYGFLKSSTYGIICLLLLGFGLIGFLYHFGFKRVSNNGIVFGIVFSVAFVLLVSVSFFGNYVLAPESEGIIMRPTVSVISSPNDQGQKLFSLHEGSKVLILEDNAGWLKVQFTKTKVGWVEAAALQEI